MVYGYIAGIICSVLLAVVGVAALVTMHKIHKITVELVKDISEQANTLIANAIEKERITLEEYREAIGKPTEGTPPEFNDTDRPEYGDGFNPHNYIPPDEE